MNISVVRATEVESIENLSPNALFKCKLTKGYPFLVNDDTQEIIEPAFRYIWERHGRRGSYVENSAIADADDLRDWYQYLGHFKIAWDMVDRTHIEEYRDYMLELVSPHTNEPYSIKTIRRRVGTVLELYRRSNKRGDTFIDIGDEKISVRRRIDNDPLAHLGKRHEIIKNEILPDDSAAADDEVGPLNSRQYQLIAQALGPIPGQNQDDTRPVRDRLWSELCLHTGMRPIEPAQLTVHLILNLSPQDPDNPAGLTTFKIIGKGNVKRSIQLPNLVLNWLHWYINNERKQAIDEGRRRGAITGRVEPAALFVNGVSARHNAGKPTNYDSFWDAFQTAVRKAAKGTGQSAGLMRTAVKINPNTQQAYTELVPCFTPHCLRHTHSVWTYLAEKAQGNAEPWKELSARLGHKDVATTTAIYLRVAGDFEAQLSDRATAHIAKKLVEFYGSGHIVSKLEGACK